MEIQRIDQEEIMVRFQDNPSTTDSAEWLTRFRSFLNGTEKLVRVDLTPLELLTSLGVNVVVGIYQRMEKQGGTIRVEVASDKTRHVLELFQLTTLFEVQVVQP
jgi:anti-anti-sigma factor